MDKILLILTGGTICSFIDDKGVKDSDIKKAAPLLIEHFRNSNSPYKNQAFDVRYPLDILSENMRIQDWNEIIKCFKTVDFKQYKGIIMTHGTDTLAYSAAMLALVLAGIEIPLMMISSQYPLRDVRANGNENFKNAVELIQNKITPNVYVVYKNENGVSYIHEGSRLNQCLNYSNDFYSSTMIELKNYLHLQRKIKKEMILYQIDKLKNNVLNLEPYVGIDYNAYNLKGKRAVLHGTFHSSTACTEEGAGDILSFIKKCKEQNILFVVSPFQAELLNGEAMYSSTGKILAAGAIAMPSLTKEYAYAKLVVVCSLYEKREDLLKEITK